MNSRLALSALFILIAALVLASQGDRLPKKFETLQTFWAGKISEARSLLVLYHSCASGGQPHAAETATPDGKTITLNYPDAAHCLDSHARHLQRFVLNLIDSDH
ncbi:MAG TPA: hypothetical protein VEF05_11485 [Terriglobales bacterium]|nr:hypothetical protein [Terriglobales bacterium]